MKIKDLELDFLTENLKNNLKGINGDCHKNSKNVFLALRRLGYDVKLIRGFYINLPKIIKHSWIESENKILETDCRQLLQEGDIMPDEFCAVLDKSKFNHRYKKEVLRP